MGSFRFKNKLVLRNKSYGTERRENLVKEVLKDSTPLPNPVVYEDIDKEFKKWVEEELSINFEDKEVPTIALFTNQRFSEYMQTWQSVDNKKNLQQNFKLITRENNPKTGTQQGQSKNIPGDVTFLMQRVEARDKNDRVYYIDYRMKQPFNVDLVYKVSLVTNKYELLNDFNLKVNEKFKAIDCYIRPNGHFMPMKLNDISDESEYNIDDRQFYSQSYNITIMAYIITEDDFVVEERPRLKVYMSDSVAKRASYAEIEDDNECIIVNSYYYRPVTLKMVFNVCDNSLTFHMDSNLIIQNVEIENIRTYKMRINGQPLNVDDFKDGLKLLKGDEITVFKVNRYRTLEPSTITVSGLDDLFVHNSNIEDVSENITINTGDND